MRLYEVCSGRPSGEVYHRNVIVCLTRERAEAVEAKWDLDIENSVESESWLWGPTIHEFDYDFTEATPFWPLVWNGYEEVFASLIGSSTDLGLGVNLPI